MKAKPSVIWILLSVLSYIAGLTLRAFDPENPVAIYLKFAGWVSFILAVGIISKPSHPLIGKIFFSFVMVMTIGVCLKVFHLLYANEIIIIGLAGMAISYASTLKFRT